MSQEEPIDYYEVLQISPNADPETIHRIYRLLAQRVHPDNLGTGDATRFRALHEAYAILSDPEKRAQYDIAYHERRQDRWRLVSAAANTEPGRAGASNDVAMEQVFRVTVLDVLYARRRTEPLNPGLFDRDLEMLIGRPREHLEFTIWYLMQKKFVLRADNSRLTITADGIDYLEQNHASLERKRLTAAGATPDA